MEDWAYWYMGVLYLGRRLGKELPTITLVDTPSKELERLAKEMERELCEKIQN